MSEPRYKILRIMPMPDIALQAAANDAAAVKDAERALEEGKFGTGAFVLVREAAAVLRDGATPPVFLIVEEFLVDVQHVVKRGQ